MVVGDWVKYHLLEVVDFANCYLPSPSIFDFKKNPISERKGKGKGAKKVETIICLKIGQKTLLLIFGYWNITGLKFFKLYFS